jgi:hypothetical protein
MRRMEARIVALPNRPDPSIRLDGDRILVDRLTLTDPGLAAWLASQPEDERGSIAERALRIGLTTLQGAGVSINLDAVRSEFDRFAEQSRSANDRAAEALESVLRSNFGDGDGRLPRTLETFLGDRGKLRSMVDELFDPKRRDSAIGRISSMLDAYFDGDSSRLATLLDPTRMGSPLHQFRSEMAAGFKAIEEKLVAIEAAAMARAGERSKSAAKGGDFEAILEDLLADIARGANDILDRTGTGAGDKGRSKKGDFVRPWTPISLTALTFASSSRPRTAGSRAARCVTSFGRRGPTAMPPSPSWSSHRRTRRQALPRSTFAPATSTASSTR